MFQALELALVQTFGVAETRGRGIVGGLTVQGRAEARTRLPRPRALDHQPPARTLSPPGRTCLAAVAFAAPSNPGGAPWQGQTGRTIPHISDNDDVGLPTFSSCDWVATAAGLAERRPDVAIVGAPFDINTTYRPGARFGPRALRSAAYNPGTYHLDLGLDIFEWLDVVDAGDAYCPHGQSARSHRNIEAKVTDVLRADAFPVIIGGDHSITYPAATAVATQVRLGQGRPAAFRRARRYRGQHRRQPALARHPDAPADRVRRDSWPQLRPGRAAWLLAAAGRFRLDARAGDDLAPDA